MYTSATALFLCKCLRLCRGFTICSLCMRPIDGRSVDLQEIDFGKRLRFSEAFPRNQIAGDYKYRLTLRKSLCISDLYYCSVQWLVLRCCTKATGTIQFGILNVCFEDFMHAFQCTIRTQSDWKLIAINWINVWVKWRIFYSIRCSYSRMLILHCWNKS